ncbi:ATP-binding protein [Candidatus Wolfebacteria bacterium]|nr:ATP-binding protein [Candidatus Wolfebacteria bacterium]
MQTQMTQTTPATAQKPKDNFFTPVANTKPYFKAAFEGFAGSGKTYTSAQIAIGLYRRIGSQKPVVIFDTEKSAKFLKPIFAQENIELLVRESRSLADLKETMARMRQGAGDILIIDSISHVWEDFLKAYAEKVRRTRLEFQDWGVIKPTWKTEFSDPFVRDPYHVIMTGRAGYEYENEINKETGKREIYKSGVKMKVEGETAYEPDLLVLMERMQDMEGGSIKRSYRQAVVIKDRSTVIDGKVFENPSFKEFEPAIEVMLQAPERLETTAERDAGLLFRTEEEKYEWKQQKKRWLEEIENYLVSVWPSQAAEQKKLKIDAINYAFNTMSWTVVESLRPEELEAGFARVQEFVRKHTESQRSELTPAAPAKGVKPKSPKK